MGPALGLALLLASPALAGETTKDGVLWIENGAAPAKGARTVKLVEQWRAGGEDSDEIFGLISQVMADAKGNVYLLDTRLSEVAVFGPDGTRTGTLSREGDGPGETRMPANMMFLPDGSLGILQIFPGRIVKVGLDNAPQGVIEFGDRTEGGFLQLMDCMAQGDHLVVAGTEIRQNPPTGRIQTSYAAACTADGKELVRYASYRRELDFSNLHWIEDDLQQVDFRKSVVGRDGRVYLAPFRNEYHIDVYRPDGARDRVITRAYEHRQRTAGEFERIDTMRAAQFSRLPGAKWTTSKTEPDISALRIGPDGNLWVETSRGGVDRPEGVFYTWDVFDPDGHFIEQVSAACPGDGDDDMMLWTADGAVQVTGFVSAVRALQSGGAGAAAADEDAAPMEVIRYRTAP